jgi:hypothetical protein
MVLDGSGFARFGTRRGYRSKLALFSESRYTTAFLRMFERAEKGRLRVIWEGYDTARWKKADVVTREWKVF